MALDGVEDSFVPAIVAEHWDRFLVAAIFNLVLTRRNLAQKWWTVS